MYNRKLHILLYFLLFVYIIISLFQYFHFKNEINEKTKRIENLNIISQKNDEKIQQIKDVRQSYDVLERYLDSINELSNAKNIENEKEVIKKKKTTSETKVKVIKSDSVISDLTTSKIDNLDKIEINPNIKNEPDKNKSDQTKLSPEELKAKAELIRPNFFNDIIRVYSNAKNPKPISSKDKKFWIEIESENGNFKNSIQNIIKQITLNGISVRIINILERNKRVSNGFISVYHIQVKVPKGIIYQKNRLIVSADIDYIKLFMAVK